MLVVGLFILTFVVQHFEIPSRSMERTLLVGDHVFVDRLTPLGRGKLGWVLAISWNSSRGHCCVPHSESRRAGNVPGEAHYWRAGRPDSAA